MSFKKLSILLQKVLKIKVQPCNVKGDMTQLKSLSKLCKFIQNG